MKYPLAFALVAFSTLSHGQPTADKWNDLERLSSKQQVKVTLRNGDTLKGTIRDWTSVGLTLTVAAAQSMTVTKSDVLRITKKSRARGAMWGGIIGFGIAPPISAYAGPYMADIGNPPASTRLRWAFGFGGFIGGIGAGIGALTGIEQTLYGPSRAY